jgi:hypothetical protein
MRRIAQMFEGVDILTIRLNNQIVQRSLLNLSPLRLKILRLFGPQVLICYLVDP